MRGFGGGHDIAISLWHLADESAVQGWLNVVTHER
jgi:hypothetical protein